MAKNKLNANNLLLRQPPAAPAPKAKRPSPRSVADFVEGDRPKRGRPRSLVEKKGVMMYVPEDLHEDFRICTKIIARRDMTDVLEELMRKYVEAHRKSLDAIRDVQAPSRKAV